MKKTGQEKLRLWLVRAVWTLAGITLAAVIAGVSLFFAIRGISGGDHEGEIQVYSREQIDKFITGVLVIVQNEPLRNGSAEADLIYIASFNSLKQELTMAALENGLLVDTEEDGRISLGAAYASGGSGRLVNVVNACFELDIQNYVCTDAHSLAAMIDLLGGVKVKLSRAEAKYISDALGSDTPQGETLLTGTQCMVYALDDISDRMTLGSARRGLRLLESGVLDMRKNATKENMMPLLAMMFNSTRTNLDLLTLTNLGYEILKAEDMEYKSFVIPCDGSWKQDDGFVTADLQKNTDFLRTHLYNPSYFSFEKEK